jgi:hypothetical protein
MYHGTFASLVSSDVTERSRIQVGPRKSSSVHVCTNGLGNAYGFGFVSPRACCSSSQIELDYYVPIISTTRSDKTLEPHWLCGEFQEYRERVTCTKLRRQRTPCPLHSDCNGVRASPLHHRTDHSDASIVVTLLPFDHLSWSYPSSIEAHLQLQLHHFQP